MRRFSIIFGLLLALITLGIVIYFLFFRGAPETPQEDLDNPFGGISGGLGEPRDIEIPEVGVPVGGAGEEVAPQFFKITDGPVAHGAVVIPVQRKEQGTGTSTPTREDTEVRYVDRASGNVYRFRLKERTLERITNLTLPGIQEAVWASDGSRAFLRFLSTEAGGTRLETYALSAEGEDGYFLEPNLSDVVVNGTSSILSVLPSSNGAVGTRASLTGTNPVTVFQTQLSSLKVHRAGETSAAHTKASALIPGYAFSISRTGEFTRILGPLPGLTILPSPSGTRFLYTYRDNGVLRLGFLDTETNETVALPVSTLSEKCVWGSSSTKVYCAVPRAVSGTLPDDWYLGVVQTSDRIWEIDLTTRLAALTFDPSVLADADIDAVALTLDAKNEVLVFTNRDDGSLWLYDL